MTEFRGRYGLLSSRFSPLRIYLLFTGLTALGFSLYATLSSVYRVEVAQLDPLQLILIGSALELTVFLFEIPTGIVADLYSRRRSVIIGMVLFGAGFVLEGALPLFATMLLAQVLWGLGVTFESGAIDAWVSDEVGADKAGDAFLRASQVGQVVSFLGIGGAVLLGNRYLGLPMVAGGICFLLAALFLIVFMSEENFSKNPDADHNPFKAMRSTFRAGLEVANRKPVILTIFAISAILGASSEAFDRLSTAHFIRDIGLPELFTPAVLFGLIGAGTSLLSIVVTEIVRRRVDTNAHIAVARALFGINTLLSLCMIAFGLAGNFLVALAFYGTARMLRIVSGPLYRAWLNQSLEDKTRATVFSMNGQMDALGQIAGGPVLGLVARSFGMPITLVIAGCLLLPASYLFSKTLRNDSVSDSPTIVEGD